LRLRSSFTYRLPEKGLKSGSFLSGLDQDKDISIRQVLPAIIKALEKKARED